MNRRSLLTLSLLLLGLGVGVACPVPIPILLPGPVMPVDVPERAPVCDGGAAILEVNNNHVSCGLAFSLGGSDSQDIAAGAAQTFAVTTDGTFELEFSSRSCTPTPATCRVTLLCGQSRSITATGSDSTVDIDCTR